MVKIAIKCVNQIVFVSDKHTILDLIGIRLPEKTLLSRIGRRDCRKQQKPPACSERLSYRLEKFGLCQSIHMQSQA